MRSLPSLLLVALLFVGLPSGRAERKVKELKELPQVSLDGLADRNISELGRKALGIKPLEWKHSETEHFVYHSPSPRLITPVATEAEFYYRVIAKELQRDTTQWQRKAHIFIFEQKDDWSRFVSDATLDPWTGGFHRENELFIRRAPGAHWENRSLGHEVTHLVIHRFLGNGVPLWLNEGYAEYASIRGFAAYMRARGYKAKPVSNAVSADKLFPLQTLFGLMSYPDEAKVNVFYDESEKLVRFLAKTDSTAFIRFFDAMSRGNRFENALSSAYGVRFSNLSTMEQEFRTYATKDFGTTIQDKDEN